MLRNLFAIATTAILTGTSLASNLVASFPKSITIYKDDILAFQVNHFINGTQTSDQAYPNPTIELNPESRFSQPFTKAEDCVSAESSNEIQTLFICPTATSRNFTRILYLYKKLENNTVITLDTSFDLASSLPSTVQKPLSCFTTRLVQDVVFVSCYGNSTTYGKYSLLVYALSIAGNKFSYLDLITDSQYVAKSMVIPMTMKNFIIRSIGISTTVVRLACFQRLLKQKKYSFMPEATSRTLLTDFDFTKKKFNLIFTGTWLKSSQGSMPAKDAYFALKDEIYFLATSSNSFYHCKLNFTFPQKNSALNCVKSELSYDDTSLQTFKMWYNTEKKDTFLMIVGSKSFTRCIIGPDDHPINLVKLQSKCLTIQLNFSPQHIMQLYSEVMGNDRTYSMVLIPFYSKNLDAKSNLHGYLIVSVAQSRAQYVSVWRSQASRMWVVDGTFYMIKKGVWISLEARKESKFFLKSPPPPDPDSDTDNSKTVYLSSYSPAQKEEPHLINTTISRGEDEAGVIDLPEISQISLYGPPDLNGTGLNTTTYNFPEHQGLGFNGKMIKGNNLQIQYIQNKTVKKAMDQFELLHISTTNEMDKIMGKMDKVIKVSTAYGGTFVMQEANHNINIIKCGINDFNSQFQCRLQHRVLSNYNTNYTLLRAHTKGGVLILMVSTNGVGIDILRFGKDNVPFPHVRISHNATDLTDIKKIGSDLFFIIVSKDKKKTLNDRVRLTTFPLNSTDPKVVLTNYTIDLMSYGVLMFNPTDANFLQGKYRQAYIVNCIDKLEVLLIDYSTIVYGSEMVLTKRFSLDEGEFNSRNISSFDYEVWLCPTAWNTFVFSRAAKRVYAYSNQEPSNSKINVPLMAPKGMQRNVIHMVCPKTHDAVQLLVEEVPAPETPTPAPPPSKPGSSASPTSSGGSQSPAKKSSSSTSSGTHSSGGSTGRSSSSSSSSGTPSSGGSTGKPSSAESSTKTSSGTGSTPQKKSRRRILDGSGVATKNADDGKTTNGGSTKPSSSSPSSSTGKVTPVSPIKPTNKTKKLYQINYYAFDGTQSAKKLHTIIECPPNYDRFASTYIKNDFVSDTLGFTFTLIFSKEDIKKFALYRTILSGPVLRIRTLNYTRTNTSSVLVNLTTGGTAQKALNIPVKIIPAETLNINSKKLMSIPETAPKNEPLSSYFNWDGPLFEVRLDEKSNIYQYSINISQRLNKIKGGYKTWGLNSTILDTDKKNVLIKDKKTGNVILYVNLNGTARKTYNLQNHTMYGVECREFKLISSGRTIYVAFTCIKGLQTIFMLDKLQTLEQSSKILFHGQIPFNIDHVKYAYDPKNIFVTMKEQKGSSLLLWKISKETGMMSRMQLRPYMPGSLALYYHQFSYQVVSLQGLFVVVVLFPGQNYFTVNLMSFDKNGLVSSEEIYHIDRISIHFIAFEACPNNESCIIGLYGGAGVNINEIKIMINTTDNSIGDTIHTFTFQKLMTTKFLVSDIEMYDQYYLFKGKFGSILRSGKNSKSGASVTADVYDLIYKRNVTNCFMRGYSDSSLSTIDTIDGKLCYGAATHSSELTIYEISDFTITKNASKQRTKGEKIHLRFYSTQSYWKTDSIYLSLQDYQQSAFTQIFGICIIVGTVSICLCLVRIASSIDNNPRPSGNRDSLIWAKKEIDTGMTDEEILTNYFDKGNASERVQQGGRPVQAVNRENLSNSMLSRRDTEKPLVPVKRAQPPKPRAQQMREAKELKVNEPIEEGSDDDIIEGSGSGGSGGSSSSEESDDLGAIN